MCIVCVTVDPRAQDGIVLHQTQSRPEQEILTRDTRRRAILQTGHQMGLRWADMNHVSESVRMLADRGISVVVSTNNQSLTKTSLIAGLLSKQCALAAISTPSDLVARVQAALHQAGGTGRLRFTIVADHTTAIVGIVPGAASSLFVDDVVRDDIATGPLRLGVCSWRLNASGAWRGVALASDPELNRGRHWAETQGFTEALWLNTDGLVTAAGGGIPTYRAPDGCFCLPTLEAGGPITLA